MWFTLKAKMSVVISMRKESSSPLFQSFSTCGQEGDKAQSVAPQERG